MTILNPIYLIRIMRSSRERNGAARRLILAVITLIGILAVGAGSWSCSEESYAGTAQPLTIGSTRNEADTLIYVAYEQGFFAANGLDVTIKDYGSGQATVEGMLKGEVDIATASEFVVVQSALRQQTVSTIGTIDKNYATFLIGRTDRGVRSIADLKGKKVGVPAQTAAQFYFGRSLDLNGMNRQQMTIVNTDVAQSVDLIVDGDLAAEVTWEPYVSRIKEKLGDRLVAWSAHSGQAQYKNVAATSSWLAQHPELVKRVLKSLAQAESFVTLSPDQAKAIVKERLQYDDKYVASVWPSHQFSLSVDRSLLAAMEDEGRWMISNNLTAEKQIPDFTNYMYLDGLKEIKPGAVNVIK